MGSRAQKRPIERRRTPGTPRAINNLGYEVDVVFVCIGPAASFDSIEVMAKVKEIVAGRNVGLRRVAMEDRKTWEPTSQVLH
jgi:hypothetical protein